VLLGCAGISAAYGQGTPESDAGSRIIALENVWTQAAQSRNRKALGALLDHAFVYVGPAGKRLTQAEGLAGLEATRGFQVLSEPMVVHLHGDTAVVTGIYETKGVERGKSFVRRGRFVDTWSNKNGGWRSIASLATPLELEDCD
jgi:ketosteroid isomerase-like protein